MNILKEVKEYLDSYDSLSEHIDDKSMIYQVAFVVLSFVLCVGPAIKYMLLFLTFPIWIVPYLVYSKRKESGIE